MTSSFRIVCMGDSIVWGQGLIPNEKFDWLVREALLPKVPDGVTIENLAHSGAVIGATGASGTPQPGEVPAPRPSIIEQCDGYANSPETVDLVLLDGGINDVGVAFMLNPFALIPPLDFRIKHACFDGMLTLLKKVTAKFTKPSCRILVLGYYAVVSARSDPAGVTRLLGLFGIAIPDFMEVAADFANPVLVRCQVFLDDSTARLKKAIEAAGDRRVSFVPSGFTDANSAFVHGTSFLWGLDLDDGLTRQPRRGVHRAMRQIPGRHKC